MGEAGPDHQLRRSHSDQDLWTRQQQLDRAAEFYTAVGPDGECRNKSTGWGLISEIKYASTVTSICVLMTL